MVIVERNLASQDNIDLVVSRIDSLISNAISTIVVVNDLHLSFDTIRSEYFNVDGISSSGESLSFRVSRFDGEGAWVSSVSSLQSRSVSKELRRISSSFGSQDINMEWILGDSDVVQCDIDHMRSFDVWFVLNSVGTVLVVGDLWLQLGVVGTLDLDLERIASSLHGLSDLVASLNGEVRGLLRRVSRLDSWARSGTLGWISSRLVDWNASSEEWLVLESDLNVVTSWGDGDKVNGVSTVSIVFHRRWNLAVRSLHCDLEIVSIGSDALSEQRLGSDVEGRGNVLLSSLQSGTTNSDARLGDRNAGLSDGLLLDGDVNGVSSDVNWVVGDFECAIVIVLDGWMERSRGSTDLDIDFVEGERRSVVEESLGLNSEDSRKELFSNSNPGPLALAEVLSIGTEKGPLEMGCPLRLMAMLCLPGSLGV